MNKYMMLLLLHVVTTLTLLSGCGSANTAATTTIAPPIGTWHEDTSPSDITWTFNASLTYTRVDTSQGGSGTPESGTYVTDGNGGIVFTELVQQGGAPSSSHYSTTYQYGSHGSDTTHMLLGGLLYVKQ